MFKSMKRDSYLSKFFIRMPGLSAQIKGQMAKHTYKFILAVLLLISMAARMDAQIITTIAGNGAQGFSGTMLNLPYAVCLDNNNNVYINDFQNFRIRKVSPSGGITTFAGNGTQGFSGDNGPATAANLNTSIGGMVFDTAGNFYFADGNNQRIRKVDINGIITTVAGSLAGPVGICFDRKGNLYIAESGGGRIRKMSPVGTITTIAGTGSSGFSGDGGAATAAKLFSPRDVKIDPAGNLYISDDGNSRIRKIDIAGIITTIAGNGTAGFSGDGGRRQPQAFTPRPRLSYR